MMKYIRTNNGIYELKNNMSIENAIYSMFGKFEKTNEKHLFRNGKHLGKVIDQADTIEELCDEFVLKNENVFTKPQMLEDDYNGIDLNYYKNEDIYGAIWTDKGLIYVAKMNNKGELELI